MSDETKKGTAKSPGEFELITRLKTKLQTNDSVIVGAGDDCAVIDASVPGNGSFTRLTVWSRSPFYPRDGPGKVGHKALGRALSDIAAMAGSPRWATITLACRTGSTVRWLRRFTMASTAWPSDTRLLWWRRDGFQPERRSLACRGWRGRSGSMFLGPGQAGGWGLGHRRAGGSIAGHHLDFTPRLNEAVGWRNTFCQAP